MIVDGNEEQWEDETNTRPFIIHLGSHLSTHTRTKEDLTNSETFTEMCCLLFLMLNELECYKIKQRP